ncbi:MAG: SIMPL domain-containing protein [Candidatus Uhrbacteria bacterium]|nr:SIMPL domain-containing protein [Candidatus Uhrbacteria bacterium]
MNSSFWPDWKENRLFTALLALLCIAFIFLVGFKAWNAFGEHDQIGHAPRSRDTITMDGEGKVTGKPTLAQIDLGMFMEGKDVPELQNQNSQKVNAIIAAMKGLGIAEADLQTSNYTISPKFEYKDGSQNVVGYMISQNLNLKVRDLSKLSAVLAKAGQLGTNQVNGVSFTIDDPTELKQEARKKALQDARNKAQELADALGVKVERVVTFAESSNPMIQPFPYMYKAEATGLGGGGTAPDIQPGSLDVISRVSVTFEIR